MSLRFYFGPSGAGKSCRLYREIIERSQREPRKNFLIVVPDQFTMQTQKDIVSLHEREGILNIDVLSFGRLSHRILEEVGGENVPVLDDTGKSLVLQRVAAGLRDRLPVLGGQLQRQGYIHEVKSALSEFMQYGISPQGVEQLAEFSGKRGALQGKLRDLELLYQSFLDYIRGHFITAEETLDRLCRVLHRSRLVPGSVVAFDGFTGFTPIQNRLIQRLMSLAQEVIVTVTLGEGEDPYHLDGEQKLFHLSKKTVHDLEKLADEAAVPRGQDVFVGGGVSPRFQDSPALQSLERNLFRLEGKPFPGRPENIRILEEANPRMEAHRAGLEILRLIREAGLAYRDVAVITGDLEVYAPYVESEFADMEIPCFVDRTRGISLNPMIEYIKSALQLFLKDFSYEAVFHYLRSGMAELTYLETDLLENYVRETGLRGRRRWRQVFSRKTKDMGEDEEKLARMNELRERILSQIAPLEGESRAPAALYVDGLYEFLVRNRVQEKLAGREREFTAAGQLSRAREYAQIYRLVMELLNQIYELLGQEEISRQEFYDILEACFGEIQVGTIPQNVDRVPVGDMERTRLKPVKALLFLGVNDGSIPKGVSRGGLISDMDREFLRQSGLELAPSPRQQMYIQRLYLYLNLTKPSRYLILSYARAGRDGRSLRPAYLTDTLRGIFPELTVERPGGESVLESVVTPREGLGYLARGLREYAAGSREGGLEDFFTLYAAYARRPGQEEQVRLLEEAAFCRLRDKGLSRRAARALYGRNLENSVSRLETYASCACRHFLQYGLSLRERQEFGFEPVDMGNIFHGVLDEFARELESSPYTWFDFPGEFGEAAVGRALERCAAQYGSSVLYSSARREYGLVRMKRILVRTVDTLQSQLKEGAFVPSAHELSFNSAGDLASVQMDLTGEERMRLQGRIDRIDTAQEGDRIYVKVIDYKSGSQQFDLTDLYYGLQLQLAVYMNAALEREAARQPDKEVIPAAMLYYHVEDPAVEVDREPDPGELREKLLRQLRMNGLVNREDEVISLLDARMGESSAVIPVGRKKDGSLSARSSALSGRELGLISRYVSRKVRELGREILEGHTEHNPYEMGNRQACTYCPYKQVCGFDPQIPGCSRRRLEELSRKDVLERMERGENRAGEEERAVGENRAGEEGAVRDERAGGEERAVGEDRTGEEYRAVGEDRSQGVETCQ